MSLNTTQPLTLLVAGTEIPVRPTVSERTKNTYFALLTPTKKGRKDTGFGVKVPAMGKALPKSVTLRDQDGTEIVLALEPKAATYVDRSTGKTESRKNPAVGHQSKVTLSGEEKQVKIGISDVGEGAWNMKVTVSGISGGGAKGSPVRTISEL